MIVVFVQCPMDLNGGDVNNTVTPARVRVPKRPRAVMGQATRSFSQRDKVLVALGDELRGGTKFEFGSSSKAANDEFDRAIGKRLTTARKIVGLSIDDAAEMLKISKQTLYKYEKGERTVKAKTLYDAAMLYGVDGSWLLCLTDDLKVTREDEDGKILTVTYRGV